MSDVDLTTSTPTTPAPRKPNPSELAIASAREKLSRYLGRAVEILTELAETSENDRVRLAAADSILDRAGIGKSATTQVQLGQPGEHEAARKEAEDIVRDLKRNKDAVKTTPAISIDAIIVLEGVADEGAS